MNLSHFLSKINGRKFWEVDIDGLSIKMSFSHPYHHFFARRVCKRGHEANLLVMWKRQAEKHKGTFLDCGGYSGIFGLVAAATNPASKVFIFEPDTTNFEHIKRNIALNNLDNVFPIQAAVSDNSGTVSFKKHEGGEAGSIVGEGGDLQMPCVTIDEWVEQNQKKPFLIKLDVEGAEYRVLLGARKLLEESTDLEILLEMHYNFLKRYGDSIEDIWGLLQELGYRAIYLDKCEWNEHYWVYRENKG